MPVSIPQTMTGAALYLEGVGFLGTTKEITLPSLEYTMWTANSGLGERHIDSGLLKAMTATFVLQEINMVYFLALSKRYGSYANLYAKQNITEGKKQIPLTATFRGHVSKLEMPKHETGGSVEATIELGVNFYKLDWNNLEQVLIDMDNFVHRIHGIDKYAEIKANLT